MFIKIERTISINNTGRHIFDFLNTAPQTNASDIRNITNPMRFLLKRCIGGRIGTVAAEWGTTVSGKKVLLGQSMQLTEGGGCGISLRRRHTTSRHHCNGNVNIL